MPALAAVLHNGPFGPQPPPTQITPARARSHPPRQHPGEAGIESRRLPAEPL